VAPSCQQRHDQPFVLNNALEDVQRVVARVALVTRALEVVQVAEGIQHSFAVGLLHVFNNAALHTRQWSLLPLLHYVWLCRMLLHPLCAAAPKQHQPWKTRHTSTVVGMTAAAAAAAGGGGGAGVAAAAAATTAAAGAAAVAAAAATAAAVLAGRLKHVPCCQHE